MALKVGKRILGMCFALTIMLPSFQGAEAANPTGLEARMVLDLTDNIELPNSHVGGLAGNGEYYLYVKYSDLSFHRSEDGLRWTPVSITEATYHKFHGIPRQLIWDGQQFVLLLDSQILTSSDGRDWKDVTPAHPDRKMEYTFEDIHFANGQYVILAQDRDRNVGGFYVEGDNTIFYGNRLSELKKAKKQDFMEVVGGRERPLDHVIWTGSGYLAGGNGVAYSADGKVWRGDAGLGYGYNAVWDGTRVWEADGDRILSYDAEGKFAKSVYKLTKETAKKVNLKVIGANGRSYIAAGKSGKNAPTTVMYSKDGAKWSTVVLGTEPSDIHSILPTPYGYLLAGDRIWYVSETAIDQPSAWAVLDVERAVKDKLVTPAVIGFYQSSLARQDLSILSVKLYEAMTNRWAKAPAANPFRDTTHAYVLKANQLGVMQGLEKTRFAPTAAVTRQETALALYRTLQKAGVSLPEADAAAAYREMSQQGILGGLIAGKVPDPKGTATREEAVVMAERAYAKFREQAERYTGPGSVSRTVFIPDGQGQLEEVKVVERALKVDGRIIWAGEAIELGGHFKYLLVPLEDVAESMGLRAEWDSFDRKLTLSKTDIDYVSKPDSGLSERVVVESQPRTEIAERVNVRYDVGKGDDAMSTFLYRDKLYVGLEWLYKNFGISYEMLSA